MSKSRISLGLVVYNEVLHLENCLDNIKAVAGNDLFEVILVDNKSTDHTLSLAQNWAQNNPDLKVTIYHQGFNHMARGRNKILELAQTPWIYFTDADCRLREVAWKNIISFLDIAEDRNISAFGGGNQTPLLETFVSQGISSMQSIWLGHMNSVQIKPPDKDRFVEHLSTCNLMIKKSCALKVQGFDSLFHPVGEDLSLSHRLSKEGLNLFALADISVDHHQDRGLALWIKKMVLYGQAQVHIAAKYPRHFKGLRGIQFITVLFLLLLSLYFPWLIPGIVACYLLTLCLLLKRQGTKLLPMFRGASFIFITQVSYAIGEVLGILTLPVFLAKRPKPIPTLEKI